jgi:hypothetical protein
MYSDGNVDLGVIEARQYQNSMLVKPGSFLYFVTNQSLSFLFYLIPQHCHNSYFYIKCAKRMFLVHEKVFYAETKVEAV